MTLITNEIRAAKQVYHPTVINNAATGTVNIDLRTGNAFRLGLTGNITSLTHTTALPENGWSGWLRLEPGTAGFTIVWTVSVKWVNGVEPPMSVLLAGASFLCHFTIESGELLGSWSGPYPA